MAQAGNPVREPDVDIFENKNHNGLIYNGSKPVRSLQDPREGRGNLYGFLNQGDWGNNHSDQVDRHVRNIPNRDGQK